MAKLVAEKLNKSYGEKRALNNFSYEFDPGVYGILGANGAGKSTLMKGIACILRFDSGSLYYMDRKVDDRDWRYRQALGYMPQSAVLYPNYTLMDYLLYVATIKGIPSATAAEEVEKVIKTVNLEREMQGKLKTFSGGMKQRAMLAIALLGNPEILILDEPSAGVDPVERVRIRNLISELGREKIIIISTHIVTDIEISADKIIILKDGEKIADGSQERICKDLYGNVFSVVCTPEEYNRVYKSKYPVTGLKKEGEFYRIRLISEKKEIGFEEEYPTLDDVYMKYFEEDNAI